MSLSKSFDFSKHCDELSKYVMGYCKEHPWKSAQIAIVIGMAAFDTLYKKYRSIIPRDTIIEIDLANVNVVNSAPSPLEQWFEPTSIYFRDLVDGIRKAADDKKINGLIVRLGNHFHLASFAHIQEFRDAVMYFKSKAKKTFVHVDTFGEFGNSNVLYYLASAFENIYMSEAGELNIINWSVNVPFMKQMLEKLHINTEFLKRKDYKTAANTFTEEKMTDSERESYQSLFDSLFGQIVEGIANERKIPVDLVRRYFATGPFSASTAVELKLIDKLCYLDEAYTEIKGADEKGKPKANTIYLSKYLSLTGRLHAPGTSKKNKVAYINAEGGIACGKSLNKMNGGPSIGSETLAMAIRAATLDKSIKAILLRVDSGGGSYVASCLVHHEIERAKKAGKKVVVCMGGVAASGGYLISCNADRIIAQSGTITGSIGVLVGKFNIKKTMEKVGFTYDPLKTNEQENVGDNSTLFSALYDYNDSQRYTVNHTLDDIYETFKSMVAKGRNLTVEQVEEIAQGRVWTGQQALERKLIDHIGGINEAIDTVKELIKVDKDDKVELISFPRDNILKQLLSSSSPYNSEDMDKKGIPLGISSTVATLYTPFKMIGAVFSLFHPSSTLSTQIISHIARESQRQSASIKIDSSIPNLI